MTVPHRLASLGTILIAGPEQRPMVGRAAAVYVARMHVTFKPLKDQVIVITGASSGIGLATAHAACEVGAKLVLVSRNDEALSSIVQQINASGGTAVHVPADVGRREDVERIAEVAVEQFGGFDTWVNNAGVSIYGHIQDVSEEDNQRLFATNFWGVVHGSMVAVKHLKLRGGALINIGSVASDRVIPLQGMYSASKHAVKAFTDALRMELEAENAPISVTLIKPAAIDTPYPHHARNYLPQEPKHPQPVYRPQEVAYAILYAATHARRDIFIGSGAKAMSAMGHIAPGVMDRAAPLFIKQQMRAEPPRNPQGALHQAGEGGRVRGDQPGYVMKTSLYTRAALHPAVTGAFLAAAVGVTAAALVQAKRQKARPATARRRRQEEPAEAQSLAPMM
jgi:short-subunit dehydrogenase